MTPQEWTNRAMWSAFLKAHTERRLAAAEPAPETAKAEKAGAGARQGRTRRRQAK